MSLQTANLGITSSAAFINSTLASKAVGGIAGKLKGRGSNMAGIDQALKTWETNCHKQNVDASQKMAMVNNIIYECDMWLARTGNKATVISTQRRQVIDGLKKSLRAPYEFLKSKSKVASGNLKYRSPTKALDGNYGFERQNYLEGGKSSNPVSATIMDGKNGVELGDMDYNQFKTGAGPKDKVIFLNRSKRMDLMVYVESGRFFRAGAQPASNDGFGPKKYADPYAVDKYGNMFCLNLGKKKETVGLGQFNHSSFCAGREIITAGTICFDDQGHLLYITNLSGHYKPNRPQLGWYLRMLNDEGVNLQNVCVGVINAAGNGVEHIRCPTFLGNISAGPDWPTLTPAGMGAIVNGLEMENPG